MRLQDSNVNRSSQENFAKRNDKASEQMMHKL